ncbi:hypothetical protein D1007_21291 [Hordeum vulgare]|nr:hypothetical protein D1007_21291 [Hordeum vulgare]
MIQLGLEEVPPRHVLKRWTRDARDILPPEFPRYQTDQGPLKYSSRRHNNLHLLCLEIIRPGDSNVDAYGLAMEQLTNLKTLLEPVAAVRDGMGLSDKEMAGDSAVWGYLTERWQVIPQVQLQHTSNILVQRNMCKLPPNVQTALGRHQRRDQRDAPRQAATKHHTNSQLKGVGSAQSAVAKGTRALHARSGGSSKGTKEVASLLQTDSNYFHLFSESENL